MEILELIAAYGAAWDAADADTFAGLFTEDAVCAFYRNDADAPAAVLEGRNALRHAVEKRAGRFRDIGLVTTHLMADSALTMLNDHTVTGRTAVRVVWRMPAADPEPRTVQTGHYDSVIVRTADGWKFSRRDVRLRGRFEVADVYPDIDG